MNECDFVIEMPEETTQRPEVTDLTGWESVVFQLEDDGSDS